MDILFRFVFIAAVHRLVRGFVLLLPEIRRVPAYPGNTASRATNALTCHIRQVCTEFINQRTKLCGMIYRRTAKIKFPLHPHHGKQHIFRVLLQCCFCSTDKVLIQRLVHTPAG
ncbi:hypothetical protein BW70_19590 [Escherichia coli O174:H8 str. 04-3038]|nr:hypothetical protein BW70_19590 [Escherichia coli O174:H8 str. 04-3038]